MNLVSVMKSKSLLSSLIFFFIISGFAVPVFAQNKSGPVLAREKIGYALGAGIGRKAKNLDIDIDPDMLLRGYRDAIRGQIIMKDQDIKAALDSYEKEVITRLGKKNKTEGDRFLKENGQRKAVHTLPSGLQYWILKEGTGKVPKMNDVVTIHYQARLIDGYEFENSHWAKKPAEIPVSSTIKGWAEALIKMPTGSIWRLYIPPELAYGEASAGQAIGPNAVIICDIELISVK